jgi:hypothetical protein
MKKPQITKRDLKIFFLGMVVMILIVVIYDWNSFKKGLSGKSEKESMELMK